MQGNFALIYLVINIILSVILSNPVMLIVLALQSIFNEFIIHQKLLHITAYEN